MGQDKPPQYSDTTSSGQYTPKFSPEQKSFLELVHRFAAVKPLSLKIFLDLVSEDDELFSKDFPATFKDSIGEEIDGMMSNPMFKQLLSVYLAKQDHSAALISIRTLLAVSSFSPEFGDSHQGISASPPDQTTPTSQEKPPVDPDSQPEDKFAPKFSPEQISFLDLAYRFAAVKPLSLKIFLDLISEDEEMVSKEFPSKSKESIGEEIGGMLTNSTFKPLLSAQLAKQDYPGALISISTLILTSTSNVGVEQPQPATPLEQRREDPSSKSLLGRLQHHAAANELDFQTFLDLVAEDDDLLSKTFPEWPRESIKAEIARLSSNPSFQWEICGHLENKDYLAALLSATLRAAQFPKANPSAPQYGTPLEQLNDSYSKGLYHLYDLLWNQQESITTSHTVLVPNLPYGHINFEQPAPTAILPPLFGKQPQPYSCDLLELSELSRAILPSNTKQLKKILIRTRYRDIHKELELDCHHAVILGQPGAGKSCFLTYILAERLRKRQPTVLQLDEDDVYSFSRFGAMRFPAKSSLDGNLLHDAWYLVDCSEHRRSIPDIPSYIYRVPALKVVHSVSPRNSRHVAWKKQLAAKEFWITIHSWEELYVVGRIGPTEIDVSDEKWAFSCLKYGANPRTCMLIASSSVHDTTYLECIQDDLARHNYVGYPDIANSSPTLHAIIPSLDPTAAYTTVPASPYLAEQLQRVALVDLRSRWKAITSIPYMFNTWSYHRLYKEMGQNILVQTQVPPANQFKFYYNEIVEFTDLEHLKGIRNECDRNSRQLLVPGACVFPVEAVIFDFKNSSWWLILFTAGVDRIVDGKVLDELLPVCPNGVQQYWKFLLVVPELCDSVENIRIDIGGAETTNDRFRSIPRYVLRL